MPERTKLLLLPATTPRRTAVERELRKRGWELRVFGHAEEVESLLSQGPAAVLLPEGDDGSRQGLVAKVHRLCPDALVLAIRDGVTESCADALLPRARTSKELAAAVESAAVAQEARLAEIVLRRKLQETEQQGRLQAERIKELEDECLLLQTWLRTAEEQAFRDELTDVYNRRYFVKAAEQELDRAMRSDSRFAISMMDIDRFKRYNDTYGHLKGDDLLARFAHVLLRNLRRMDTVARYGGEEFILLLPETRSNGRTEFDPLRTLERIRQAVEQDSVLNAENRSDAPVTVSAGLVRYPDDGQTVLGLMEEADARLFRAKEAGRNRVCATRA